MPWFQALPLPVITSPIILHNLSSNFSVLSFPHLYKWEQSLYLLRRLWGQHELSHIESWEWNLACDGKSNVLALTRKGCLQQGEAITDTNSSKIPSRQAGRSSGDFISLWLVTYCPEPLFLSSSWAGKALFSSAVRPNSVDCDWVI